MWKLRALILLAWVAVGCGVHSSAESTHPNARARVPVSNEFRRVEFPGFSVDVPTGLGVGDGRVADYREGVFRLEGYRRRFAMTWSTAPLLSPEQLSAMQGGPMSGTSFKLDGAQAFKLGSHDAVRAQAVVEGHSAEMVQIACGHRIVMLTFDGDEPALSREHILASFDCRPVAHDEAVLLNEVPIGVNDPKVLVNWHQIENSVAFSITNGQILISIFLSPFKDTNIESATDVFGTMLTTIHWTNTRLEKRRASDGRERQFQLSTMEVEGIVVGAVVTAWRCGDHTLLVMANAAPGVDVSAAIAVIMKLRCARPGDPPLFGN